MTGDASEFDGLTVELQHLAVDGQFAEAELVAEGLEHLSFLRERGAQGIEIGRLSRPEVGRLNLRHSDDPSPCIEDLMADYRSLFVIGYLDIYHDLTRVACPNRQVGEMRLGHCHQRHVTEYAARCPVVVVVEVAATELRDDPHGQLLFALSFQIVGDVEDGCIVSRAP